MERLTTYISGYAHGKQGRTIALAEKSKDFCRGKFEATGIVERLAAYEDTGLTPEEVEAYAEADQERRIIVFSSYDHMKEIQEIAKAESEGRLAVLPCKIGDTVYWHSMFHTAVHHGEVRAIAYFETGCVLRILSHQGRDIRKDVDDVYFTYESAEAALKERNT